MWEVSGWYSHNVYLSRNGACLVRLNDWPRGDAPSEKHIGLEIYRRGKSLASYSTKYLVRDAEVPVSTGHYEYIDWTQPPELTTMGRREEVFVMRTVGGFRHVFDIETGERLNEDPRGR